MKKIHKMKKTMSGMKMQRKMVTQSMDQANLYLDMKQEGQSVEDIMAMIYQEAFVHESAETAHELAGKALRSVKAFAEDYKAAVLNRDDSITNFMDDMDEGKTDEEKCKYWRDFTAAVLCMNLTDKTAEERKQTYCKMVENPIGEATPELVDELRAQAHEALMNSTLMTADLDALANEVSDIAEGDEAARILLSINDDEVELRAVATMIAYVKIQRGEAKYLHAGIPIEQAAVMLCASHERIKILASIDAKKILEGAATALLMILGAVVLMYVAVLALEIGFAVMEAILPMPLILVGFVMVTIQVYKVLYRAVEEWCDISEVIVKTASALVCSVARGACKLAKYVANIVLPPLVEKCKDLAGRLCRFINSKRQQKAMRYEEELIF